MVVGDSVDSKCPRMEVLAKKPRYYGEHDKWTDLSTSSSESFVKGLPLTTAALLTSTVGGPSYIVIEIVSTKL